VVTSRVLAAAAAVVTAAVLGAAVVITRDQGDTPAWWFITLLAVGLAGLAYGATSGPHRGPVLTSASVLVLLLGVLALLTVGLPLVVAGVLGFVAARTAEVTPSGAATP
jgi:hypothetical protein